MKYYQHIFTTDKIEWGIKPNPDSKFFIKILMKVKNTKPKKNQIIVIEPLGIDDGIGLNFKLPNLLSQIAPFDEVFIIDLSNH
jgi:hypothetical protein